MPRIPSYPLIGQISNNDLMIIDDVSQQYATKSVELQSLKGYFNTGQATTTYVDDKVVSGAAFDTNTGILTLTRTDGVDVPQDLDGRYIQSLTTTGSSGAATLTNGTLNIPQYLAGDTTTITADQASAIETNSDKTSFPGFGTTEGTALQGNTVIPPAYTNADVDTHLNKDAQTQDGYVLSLSNKDYTWVAQSGGGGGDTYDLNAGTKSGNSVPLNLTSGSGGDNSVVNLTEGSNITLTQTSATEITIDSAGTTGSQLYKRTFTGSELVNAFNGNLSDKIVLVSVPAGKIAIVENALFIIKAESTGTTNYNASNTLYVIPEGASVAWGARLSTSSLNVSSTDYVSYNADTGSGSSITAYGGVGADIILGPPGSGGGSISISQGDRDVVVSVAYRIVDF